MANELQFDNPSGNTLYALIRNSAGQVNITTGNTFENYTAANIATYDIALTENGDGGGRYAGDFNTNITSPGHYTIQVFLQSGASPADGDNLVGGGPIVWNGTSEEFVIDTAGGVNVTAISGDTAAADNLEATYDGTGYVSGVAPATQAALGNISSGSDSVSTTATSTEATTPAVVGNPTNDYTDTAQKNGVYHSWTPAGGELEFAYNFNIGPNASPTKATWIGYCQGNNDEVAVYARNWGGSSWDQIDTIEGTPLATVQTLQFDYTTAHVNTGVNSGDVRLRFVSTGGTIITAFATDRMLCSFTITNQSVGYANGAIWVKTVGGTAGIVDYVNGTADNPVLTWADALILSASTGITKFQIVNGSTIQLSDDSSNFTLLGEEWVLDLNSQLCSDMANQGAHVFGICTGDEVIFRECDLLPKCIP